MRRVASQWRHCDQNLTRIGDGHNTSRARIYFQPKASIPYVLHTQPLSTNTASCCTLTVSVSHNTWSNSSICTNVSLLFPVVKSTCAASAIFSSAHQQNHIQRRFIRIVGPAATDKSSSGPKKDDDASSNKHKDNKSEPTKTTNNNNSQEDGSAINTSKPNTTILGSVGVGVGVLASVFFVRGAIYSVRMSREFAFSDAPMLPFFIIIVAGLAMGCFVYTVAVLTVNERRHVEQSQLRTRAKRRCVDIFNIDDFDKSVLMKGKEPEGQQQRAKDTASPLISEIHPALNPIVRLSGAVALDVGQFSSTSSSSSPSASKLPQITQRGSSDASNMTAVVATPIYDPAIGVPFDIVASQPSPAALREGKSLLSAFEVSQPQLAKISSLVSTISSESFLTFIVEGLEGVRRRTFSNQQQQGQETSTGGGGSVSQFTSHVLALQRVVEVYQFKEKFESSAKDNTSSFSYTPEWSSQPQRFVNPSSYRVVAKASTTRVGNDDDSSGGDAYVSYVFKSATDKTLQAFPFPQVHLRGSEISGTLSTKSTSVSTVASGESAAIPRLPSGHIVAKVFGNGMLIPFPGSDKSSFLSSSYSCIAPLTLENSGTSLFFPVPGAVKLWLRTSPNPSSSDSASFATSTKMLPRLPFSGRRDTSGSNQTSLPLHTVVVDSNAFEEGRIVSWKPLSFKHLTKEGRALLEQRLGVGRDPAAAADNLVRVNVEYVRPQENAMWLFRQASAMVNTGIDLNTKDTKGKETSEGSGDAALSSLILQANNGSPHETLASMITSAAAAEGSSEPASLFSSLFSSIPSSGPAAAAYKINKALLELQTKDLGERNKKSGATSTGEGEATNTLVKNWSTPDPDPELLKVPSRRLRVSKCGTYLTTVQIDEATGDECKPRIGDVRVRYDYLPASTVALVGTVSDDPQKGQWRGQGAVVASNATATLAAADNGVASESRVVHMPYVLRAWRFTDYLAEVRRTSGGERDIEEQIKSRESLAYSAEMPSLATSVIDKTREKAASKITNLYLSAAAKDEDLTSDKEKWEETKQGFGDTVTDLFGKIIPSASVIPQWAMSAAETSLAKSLPLAVLCSSSREDASSTYLFRKHWWRDECGTWGQRYTGYLALQVSLALSTAILVPLPAVTLGYMCSGIAAGVWGQTVLMAKAELRQRALADNSWRAAHEEKEIEFMESRKETKPG